MILPLIGAGSAIGATYMAIRWALHRYDALGRRRPFPAFSVAALLVLAAVCVVPVVLRLRLEARLEQAASAIVGARVEVHCQAFGEAFVDAGQELGYVRFTPSGEAERTTLIKREQCADLRDYLRDPTDFGHEHAVAVHTLTHEAIHMRGIRSEPETECLAVQHDAETAHLLGASPEDARRLARYYWESVYPQMPEGYRSGDCRQGGTLDADSPDAPWLTP